MTAPRPQDMLQEARPLSYPYDLIDLLKVYLSKLQPLRASGVSLNKLLQIIQPIVNPPQPFCAIIHGLPHKPLYRISQPLISQRWVLQLRKADLQRTKKPGETTTSTLNDTGSPQTGQERINLIPDWGEHQVEALLDRKDINNSTFA
ncbi:hypothetical protein KGM_202010 [Danaus plexippus plexippus]|uniref:Uncharacterized protein n=1 Tax=Danaus plexippus plexippus TaxID=278856 RepID=A0A212F835_DANPL|nr:hypothetical protein KGM_202010 [Danaus plexippus plexippus]